MKSPIVETLRINAKAAPLFADIMNAAADELERLQKKIAELEKQVDRSEGGR